MAKSNKRIVSDVAYGLTGFLMKPIYDQIRLERKADEKRYNKMADIASRNILIEASLPRHFEVHQPYDPIIHDHPIW